MHDDKAVLPLGPRPIDASGRLLPLSEEERRAYVARALEGLARIETMTDESDTEDRWREILRNIDEGRPERPLFEGQY